MVTRKKLVAILILLFLIVVVLILTSSIHGNGSKKRTVSAKNKESRTRRIETDYTIPLFSTINSRNYCDSIHIAIPVDETTDVIILLKSLLLYRDSPLHIHFMVSNDFVGDSMDVLMKTWRLPQVDFTVHGTVDQKLLLAAITSSNHVKHSSMVKLFITSILPNDIDKVLYIDSEILVTANIKDLWMQFSKIDAVNIPLGMNSLQDDFCVGNPSIILYNLKIMRKLRWNSGRSSIDKSQKDWPWQSMDVNTLLCNAAEKLKHFYLSCSWNVHLKNNDYNHGCHNLSISNYKAFDLSRDSNLHQQYYRKLKEFIIQYDGSLLSYVPIVCGKANYSQVAEKSEEEFLKNRGVAIAKGHHRLMCQLLKSHSRVFRTVLYYYGDPYIPKEDHETTLVTQFSMNRLRTLRLLIEQWDGPFSISMYGSDTDTLKFSEFISTFGLLSKRDNINIHMIYKEGEFYPVNYLRNIAINTVKTAYVFLNDGDFIPMKGLFTYLKRAGQVLVDKEHSKTALVVPAFQTSQFRLKYPKSKRELVQMIKKKSVSTFCPECTHKSHQATNYKTYFESTDPYLINWVSRYEPYIVVRSDVVRYDERFMGYGYNKLAHITLLKAQGYRFIGLPDVFIIHTPHPPSIDREIWDHPSFKACIDSVWKKFLVELQHKYGRYCLVSQKSNGTILFPLHSNDDN